MIITSVPVISMVKIIFWCEWFMLVLIASKTLSGHSRSRSDWPVNPANVASPAPSAVGSSSSSSGLRGGCASRGGTGGGVGVVE